MGRVIVIGAGVIGLSVALSAAARGLEVTVVDRSGPAAGASAGNAGAFAFTDIFPLASPGIIRKAPRWLCDPLGPLSIPPTYALRIMPWLWQFWRASSPERFAAATQAHIALMRASIAALGVMAERDRLSHLIVKRGQLQLYDSASSFRASLAEWDVRAAAGVVFRHVTGHEIGEIQPGLTPRLTHGTFTPNWQSVTDPRDYTLTLANRLRDRGGTIEVAEVRALSAFGVETSAGPMEAHHVVVAAGAHSHQLLQTMGVRIPLETERGYNTTLPLDSFDLRTHITFVDHGFVIAPLASGLRVGGAVELGGLDLEPNFARADSMLRKAAAFLPGLRITGGRQWMGFRPSLPDSLPAIGHLGRNARTICAFGHGHLGLTQSPGTAEIVADLLTGRAPAIDIAPFSPDRFAA